MLPKILIICLLTLPLCLSQTCNITHFQFFSKYSLGKQQQLNRTFTQIEPQVKLPNISYVQATKTYTLHNFNLRFQYLDSNQRAVILDENTILIDGGILEVTVEFNWTQQNLIAPLYGTGVAVIKSSSITFEKCLYLQKGYLIYKLGYAYDIMFKFSNFTLVKISPPNTTEQIKKAIQTAIDIPNQNASLKQVLPREINKLYSYTLEKKIQNQHYPLDDHFDYIYYNPWTNKNTTINFLLFPNGFSLTQLGLSLAFTASIKDDAKWKCGKLIPTVPRDLSIYGGLQQFLSFSIIQNTLRYAFQKHYIDTILNKNNWESSYFQFFAGDLYEVIPTLANQFRPSQRIQGSCVANTQQQPTVKRYSIYTILATTSYNCQLSINNTRIVDLQIKLDSTIQMTANITHVNFKVAQVYGTPRFHPLPNYEIKNLPLAQLMFAKSLNRLKEGNTFGSGWKTYPRDYPHVIIDDDYFLIYDSSHVKTTRKSKNLMNM